MPLIPAESGEFEARLCSKFQASQDPSVVVAQRWWWWATLRKGLVLVSPSPPNLGATVCTDISESLATQARRLGVGIRSGME